MGDIERLARQVVNREPVYKNLNGVWKERAVQYEYRKMWRVIFRTLPVPQKRQKTERTFPTKTGLSL